jgi:hypothetical protein
MHWGDKMRNAGSFAVSGEVLGIFMFSILLLDIALYSFVGFEYYLRVPDLLGFYLFEAMLAMLGPFIIYGLADISLMEQYRETSLQMRERFLFHMLLDQERNEQIRRSHRFNPLLLWMLPPRVRHIRSELHGVSMWYAAFVNPEDSPARISLRDPLMFSSGLCILFVLLPILVGPSLLAGTVLPRWMVLVSLVLLGTGSLVLGLALLRNAAIRLALADFIDAEQPATAPETPSRSEASEES